MFVSKGVECCISQLSPVFFFNAEQQPPISVVSTTHVYVSLIFHIACGPVAAPFLLQHCLHSRIQLKTWPPMGTCYCHGKEKDPWSNHTIVLKVSLLDEG